MKNNNNKKKVLPLLLALLLLISAGAYGTRAFFTDEEELKTSIKIETGTIDIEAPTDYTWMYEPIEPSVEFAEYKINKNLVVTKKVGETSNVENVTVELGKGLGQQLSISNARPGDVFTMIVEVKNNSKLDMLISDNFTAATYDNRLYTFEFTNKFGDSEPVSISENEDFTLIEAGETMTYQLKVAVNSDAESVTFNVVDLNGLTKLAFNNITLKVMQPNAN